MSNHEHPEAEITRDKIMWEDDTNWEEQQPKSECEPEVRLVSISTTKFEFPTEELSDMSRILRKALEAQFAEMSWEISPPKYKALIGGKTVEFATILDKFNALADAWDNFNSDRSVVDYDDLSHLQLMSMGPSIIPLLMERLRKGSGRWIYALKCISGEEAETADMRGDADRVIEAWVQWGKRNGYIK
jgi:hypothetical protein